MRITTLIRSPLFALLLLAMSAAAFAQINISISFAPPELPVYEQPLCPGEGYLWTPGYWAYANDYDDYYWVPGTWVQPPQVGFLWTPAYWGWGGNGYVFYDGYWGPQVGFYGGINYGYGYFGQGFEGGRWDHDRFFYNRSVTNVNVTVIHNVYNTTVINRTVNRVSYNGGNGGVSVRPRPEEEAAAREKHLPAVAAQTQDAQAARSNPKQRVSVNHGAPPVAAMPKPGVWNDRAVVPAKATGTPYNREANRAATPPAGNTPAGNAPPARPENNARPDRPANANRPEPTRPVTTQPTPPPTGNRPEINRPEVNRPEPNRTTSPEPNNRADRPEASRPPATEPNNRPEPNRNQNEPPQRPAVTPPNDRSQPERTTPPVEPPRAAKDPSQKGETRVAEQKKHQEEQAKQDEKPQQ